ncbi:LacI family transcriptional regulator [Cellulomonas sp. APG4]|uniref:LacI family DNA-binding transcriptional regulator n=1 Tax=Cellulomonas sp. APG4 TaxID=1538656 RepID=UPI00137A4BF6|nr:LacI family DNA-binding transcriptional regulator [Cellulomonas sp. APG4]NCT91433.1 LacI family transcriptional regulator [Cellulomonas sp. APG4]
MPSTGAPRRATIRDVAVEAGLSRGTVTRVLNGERYVSPAAREAVERAVAKVGYVPNTAARNLALRRTHAIGFCVHEPHALFLEDPNIGSILLGANSVLSAADFQMVSIVIDSLRDSERVARYLSGGFVDGAIVVSARQDDSLFDVLHRLSVPATLVGRPPEGITMPWVGIDNRGAAAAVATHLLATGRRRVGMLAAALDRDSGADRLAGFRDALGDRFDPELVVELPLYEYTAGRAAMTQLLARAPELDAVFAASDAVAAGALEALRAAGRRVPDDVALVGFDDSSWALRCDPPLTTVHQPARVLGERAAQSVLAQLRGAPADLDGSLLETHVVVRGSA